MVKRVAQRVRHGRAPGVEFLARGGVAGDEALRDAVGAERAPFVVIAPEPDLGEVGEAVVVGDLRGRQMAVVIVDRFVFRERVVKLAGSWGGKQEVVVDECGHGEI